MLVREDGELTRPPEADGRGSAGGPVVAVLVPCRNEEATVCNVVDGFRRSLPEAAVFVYDNGSVDGTAAEARRAGAIVRSEPLPGKGNVVRRMFADVEADVFVLVDGDDTYDASAAPRLVGKLLAENLDMVSASRMPSSDRAHRPGHRFGNRILTALVASVFGNRLADMLSGYRVLSRRFVKSFPALSRGFEIETELTVHALELRLPIVEMPLPYRERPRGSVSKLNTIGDGVRIVSLIARLIKEERPFGFFLVAASAFAVTSLAFGVPIVLEFVRTGFVPRFPTAMLAAGLMVLAFLCLSCGLVLDTVTRGRIELKRLHYLSLPIRFSGRAMQPRSVRGNSLRAGLLREVSDRE